MAQVVEDRRIEGCAQFRLVDDESELMQIRDSILKCVAFIMCYDEGVLRPIGTGAFVIYGKSNFASLPYFITAKHIVEKAHDELKAQSVKIRLNHKTDGVRSVDVPLSRFQQSVEDGSVDFCALKVDFDMASYDHTFYPLAQSGVGRIGPGSETVTIGLFHRYYGEQKNIPVVRAGSVAAMPGEPIALKGLGKSAMCIVETRSFGGLSGSPVFGVVRAYENLQMSLSLPLHEAVQRGIDSRLILKMQETYHFLGLVHGHWDVDVNQAFEIKKEDIGLVNQGMFLATPRESIFRVLNEDQFEAERQERARELRERGMPTPD